MLFYLTQNVLFHVLRFLKSGVGIKAVRSSRLLKRAVVLEMHTPLTDTKLICGQPQMHRLFCLVLERLSPNQSVNCDLHVLKCVLCEPNLLNFLFSFL